jgi:two-component system, OmpR family, response regulator QseB
MNTPVPLTDRPERIPAQRSEIDVEQISSRPMVLVATIDPEIRIGLTELFQGFSLDAIWLRGVEAAKNALSKEKIAACLCGFWLQDGTYRELVRHIRRQRMDMPVIIVSAPACPQEYGEYLTAMNLGALDFLCHPYQKSELERMLWLATGEKGRSMNQQTSMLGPDLHTGEAA